MSLTSYQAAPPRDLKSITISSFRARASEICTNFLSVLVDAVFARADQQQRVKDYRHLRGVRDGGVEFIMVPDVCDGRHGHRQRQKQARGAKAKAENQKDAADEFGEESKRA